MNFFSSTPQTREQLFSAVKKDAGLATQERSLPKQAPAAKDRTIFAEKSALLPTIFKLYKQYQQLKQLYTAGSGILGLGLLSLFDRGTKQTSRFDGVFFGICIGAGLASTFYWHAFHKKWRDEIVQQAVEKIRQYESIEEEEKERQDRQVAQEEIEGIVSKTKAL